MTRRIAVAILLTLWVMLVTGGIVAYLITRALLLADFDRTLLDRAMAQAAVHSGTTAAAAERFPDDRFVITNQRGQALMHPQTQPAATPPLTPHVGSKTFAILADGRRLRSITLQVPAGPDGTLLSIVYSSPTEPMDRILYRLALALSASGVATGLLATYVAVSVARAALRPLRTTARVIGSIDDAHLDRRIDTAALPPELVPMGQKLNAMLERLEKAFAQRKQFLADASHELRTPIAALLTTIEVAVRHRQSEAELRRTLADCLGDARMLRQLVESLMQQARSEQFQHDEPYEAVDIGDILEDAVRVARALAAPLQVEIVYHAGGPIVIGTQPNRLRSVVRNIINNAVEHNRPGGKVEVSAAWQGRDVAIAVQDTGAGISAADLPHLFEPFYRADEARSATREHLGLGLFLVQTHLQALGGTCQVQSELGIGTVFRMRIPSRLPAAPDPGGIAAQDSTNAEITNSTGH